VIFGLPNTLLTQKSIVAVHGLGSNWKGAWTDQTTDKLWLRDFLPVEFPNTRVFSFGYDSAYVLSKSVSDISSAAASLLDSLDGERQTEAEKKRPIIFVAHSMGGIVTKKVSSAYLFYFSYHMVLQQINIQ
jgi:hypothetical protein